MNTINYNVMESKHSYSAPEAELLEVKFEERFMVDSPDPSNTYNQGGSGSYRDDINPNGGY